MIEFTGERIVPQAENCEPNFADKMYQEHVARYAFAAQWATGKSVLDVGCGVGYGSRWLADHGAGEVTAFDLSEGAIEHARQFYAHPRVTFQIASATNFDFQRKFDLVTCFELIEHVDEQEAVIECISRAMSDDGVLVISTPRALEQKRTHFHTKEFSLEEFRALLQRNFPNVRFFFENNHFSSLISDSAPTANGEVFALKDQFALAQADYFIAIATKSRDPQRLFAVAKPVLVLNDDKYVTHLERDVGILHEAENRLKDAARLREQEFSVLHTEAEDNKHQLTEMRREIGRLRRELELERAERSYLDDVISQIQSSSSWRLTAPYRALGRSLKYPLRITRKALEYRRMHGTRALAGAVKRRLNPSSASGAHVPVALPQASAEAQSPIANRQFDVVFAIGCWEGESKRYRVYNIADGLRKLGYDVHVMPFERIADLARENVKSRVVVLFRAPFETAFSIEEFLHYARVRYIKVVFDVDDLVFDPSVISETDGVKHLSDIERQQYVDGVRKYRALLERSDLVTVPTEFLREKVEALGKTALCIPNSINAEQIRIAAELNAEGREPNDRIRIGYFSGSRTHQADFAQCADAVFALMDEHPEVVLCVVGYLDLGPQWSKFGDRVERIGFQPYQVMMRTLKRVDINIAPLDTGSAFCHGKSELKYFEAGLLEVPTVASASDTYRRAIDHGITGFLANSTQEWKDCLEALVSSQELRSKVGRQAKKDTFARYGYDHVAERAAEAYGLASTVQSSAIEPVASTLPPGKLRITWVVPGLIIGGGGHRNILRAAYFLSSFGHKITLYFVGTEQDPITLKEQINKHFYPLDCDVYLFEGTIRPTDVIFATHWSTVEAALAGRDVAKEVMYFVQDFEPAFAPMGTEYVLAENTYRLGLYHITSGPWCEVILRRDYAAEADHFRFPVDREIYYPRSKTYARKNIIFFAKPEMPRRCFELGIMALRHLHRLCPDVEIIMFGSKHASKEQYDFPVTVREIVPTLDDLAQMYSNGDVGLVFSTTNPSLIPYEMMACGLPVVDLQRGDNAVNYDNRQDIALLANPLPEKMALDIAALLANPDELARRRAAGLAFIEKFPSEEQMARRIESLILARMESHIATVLDAV